MNEQVTAGDAEAVHWDTLEGIVGVTDLWTGTPSIQSAERPWHLVKGQLTWELLGRCRAVGSSVQVAHPPGHTTGSLRVAATVRGVCTGVCALGHRHWSHPVLQHFELWVSIRAVHQFLCPSL